MTHPPGTKLCACGCDTSLANYRVDAKWATGACEKRWKRANPGKSAYDAQATVVGPTKPRRASGVSVRIAARGAIDALEAELRAVGIPASDARERARRRILPLVAPRHRSLV